MKSDIRINGKPTKDLFISMLIKDISLLDSISDLIDNSVDGAIRLKPDKRYKGLNVNIDIEEEKFIISDNCGGISIDLASNYAFRFGRPDTTPSTAYSVGQFGIGMKRALFKMGNKFEIKSVTKDSRFVLEIDINKWRVKEDEWDFEFKELEESINNINENEIGTKITITSINADVKKKFKNENFIAELIAEIEKEHLVNITNGLCIKINEHTLEAEQLNLLTSDEFKTAYVKKTFNKPSKMDVTIYAGISNPDLKKGGWYIFCNDRLIMGPEQTKISGWGEDSPVKIPKYHGQFERFRGHVFFSAEDASQLPWNTAKNNVDIDSPKFQTIKHEMMKLARPVIDFLNKLHDESGLYINKQIEEKVLEQKVINTKIKKINEIEVENKFIYPKYLHKKKEQNEVKISYCKPDDKVEKLKKYFDLKSRKQVGEKTFDYTFDREIEE